MTATAHPPTSGRTREPRSSCSPAIDDIGYRDRLELPVIKLKPFLILVALIVLSIPVLSPLQKTALACEATEKYWAFSGARACTSALLSKYTDDMDGDEANTICVEREAGGQMTAWLINDRTTYDPACRGSCTVDVATDGSVVRTMRATAGSDLHHVKIIDSEAIKVLTANRRFWMGAPFLGYHHDQVYDPGAFDPSRLRAQR